MSYPFPLDRIPLNCVPQKGNLKSSFFLCAVFILASLGDWSLAFGAGMEGARSMGTRNLQPCHSPRQLFRGPREDKNWSGNDHQGHFHSITCLYWIRGTLFFLWSCYLSNWHFMVLLVSTKINQIKGSWGLWGFFSGSGCLNFVI